MTKTKATATPVALDQETKFAKNVIEHLKAGYQLFHITSVEEKRIINALTAVANNTHDNKLPPMAVITWDVYAGFRCQTAGPYANKPNVFAPLKIQMSAQDRSSSPSGPIRDPLVAFQAITRPDFQQDQADDGINAIVIFKDIDPMLLSPQQGALRRALRNAYAARALAGGTTGYYRPVFMIGTDGTIHSNVRAEITVLDFDLPDADHLHTLTEAQLRTVSREDPTDPTKRVTGVLEHTAEQKELIVRNLQGLSAMEAADALTLSIVRHKQVNDAFISTLRDQKADIIRKSEMLTYIPETKMLQQQDISGYENFFEFIERRKLAYSPQAIMAKLDTPKGVCLLGVPGTGKSVVAKMVPRILGMPGYILDVGAVFGSMVGESEKRMRLVLQQIAAQDGCVVILDEADKALGGMHEAGGDNGTARRVFGQFLSWLTDKSDRTFTILTMNRVDDLPPELLRPGRFDAVFYTTLPTKEERQKVFEIHFNKRGVTADKLQYTATNWSQLVYATEKWAHAEIEAAVVESRYVAFRRNPDAVPTYNELLQVISSITPMAKRHAGELEKMLQFCASAGQPVSLPPMGELKMPTVRPREVIT